MGGAAAVLAAYDGEPLRTAGAVRGRGKLVMTFLCAVLKLENNIPAKDRKRRRLITTSAQRTTNTLMWTQVHVHRTLAYPWRKRCLM
jgi:hypothetical protein